MDERRMTEFLEFLDSIQLQQFHNKLVKIGVTRIDHLEHVHDTDLLSINMSNPEVRRLIENYKLYKKRNSHFLTKLRKSFLLKKDEPSNLFQKPIQQLTKIEEKGDDKPVLKCLINEKDIVFKDMLGKGAFGYVQSAVWTTGKNQSVIVAVKCLQGTSSGIAAIQDELIREANAMSNLSHPNLIRLYGVVMASPMCLVTELAPLGSLLRTLRHEPNKFLLSTLCSFVVQLVAGMKYLETSRFVHRDLAARNILLMTYEKIKIGDFGLARPLPCEASYYIMQPDGMIPFAWCAPECLNFRKFSHASDLWAFGVTAFEMFSYGAEPWPGLNGSEILNKIDEPNYERLRKPKHCPLAIHSLLNEFCWQHQPEKRGTFFSLEKEILKVLPVEVRAITRRTVENEDELCFEEGDVVTVYDTPEDELWKGQNRRTREIGTFPKDLVNLKNNKIAGVSDMFVVSISPEDEKCDTFQSSRNAYTFNRDIIQRQRSEYCEQQKKSLGKSCTSLPLMYDNNSGGSLGPCTCASTGGSSYCEECSSFDSGYRSICSSDYLTPPTTTSSYMHPQSATLPINIPNKRYSMLSYIRKKFSPQDSSKFSPQSSSEKRRPLSALFSGAYNEKYEKMRPASCPATQHNDNRDEILRRRRSLPRPKRLQSFENKMFNNNNTDSDPRLTFNRSDPRLTPSPQPTYDVIPDKAQDLYAAPPERHLYGNDVLAERFIADQIESNKVKRSQSLQREASPPSRDVLLYDIPKQRAGSEDDITSCIASSEVTSQPVAPPRAKGRVRLDSRRCTIIEDPQISPTPVS